MPRSRNLQDNFKWPWVPEDWESVLERDAGLRLRNNTSPSGLMVSTGFQLHVPYQSAEVHRRQQKALTFCLGPPPPAHCTSPAPEGCEKAIAQ